MRACWIETKPVWRVSDVRGNAFFSIAAAVLSSFENPDKKCEKNLAVKGFSFYTSSSIWWRLGTVMKWSRVKISLYASKVGWGGRLRKGATWHSKIALLSHYFLASQDALEVMLVSESVTLRTDLTDVTLVSEDTYWKLYWWDSGDWWYSWRWC